MSVAPQRLRSLRVRFRAQMSLVVMRWAVMGMVAATMGILRPRICMLRMRMLLPLPLPRVRMLRMRMVQPRPRMRRLMAVAIC